MVKKFIAAAMLALQLRGNDPVAPAQDAAQDPQPKNTQHNNRSEKSGNDKTLQYTNEAAAENTEYARTEIVAENPQAEKQQTANQTSAEEKPENARLRVTSSETAGRTSKDSLLKKVGNTIRYSGLGALGAIADNAPTWLKAGATGVALYLTLSTAFGSKQKHGGFMDKIKTLTQKYSQGSLSDNAMGEKMEFDLKTLVLGALAFGKGGDVNQMMGAMGGGAGGAIGGGGAAGHGR